MNSGLVTLETGQAETEAEKADTANEGNVKKCDRTPILAANCGFTAKRAIGRLETAIAR